MRSIQAAMVKASTAHHQHTNHLTKVRIETKIRRRTVRTNRLPASPRARKSIRVARIQQKNLTKTKVPIAHLKISIPAVIAALSTKVKTKTGIVNGTRIDIVAIQIKAARVVRNIKVVTRTVNGQTRTSTKAPALHTTKTNRHRLATKKLWMLSKKMWKLKKR